MTEEQAAEMERWIAEIIAANRETFAFIRKLMALNGKMLRIQEGEDDGNQRLSMGTIGRVEKRGETVAHPEDCRETDTSTDPGSVAGCGRRAPVDLLAHHPVGFDA